MKHLLRFTFVAAIALVSASLKAQGPFLGTVTIIPSTITSADHIKIITEVTTPNQGILVSSGKSVNTAAKKIDIYGCYWLGMLTAIKTFKDTFDIGVLPPGVYSLSQKAYASSDYQQCVKVDSSLAAHTFTVVNVTGIKHQNEEQNLLSIYPNPVNDVLYIKDLKDASIMIYAANGALVKKLDAYTGSAITTDDLPSGIYILKAARGDKTYISRFVKQKGE